jgi:hypothetical protein
LSAVPAGSVVPLRNACFISYRHGKYDLVKEFTSEFYSALSNEVEPILGGNAVFMDHQRLEGGYLYNEGLSRGLYESATMVLLYTPTYFEAEYPYCAREYRAMVALEQQRLARLGAAADASRGLIIPVVLRGLQYLPDEIRLHRQFHNFESFQLGGRRLSRHPKFAPAIRQIAAYVCERFRELRSLPEETFSAWDQFALPSEDDVRTFLEALPGYRLPFPRGGEFCAPKTALTARL